MSKMVPQLSTAVSAVLAALLISTFGVGFQPEFAEPLENLTIPVGRDAVFRCMVQHLGGYRVGWVKADTKAIQAIHDHVITHNPRVSVSHSDHTTWNLQVRAVQEEDRGAYMCQINTDPMKSQMGYLDVVVPPDFVNEETSGDAMVPEGGTAKLTCKARGYPTPHVTWRREDSAEIVVKDVTGKTKVSSYQGEVLKLAKITRSEMGAYLCIASNGIPPSVSKRILVNVHFHPVIQVPNQLVGAPTGTDVTLECYVEASPKSINYWVRDSGEMVISSEKYEVQGVTRSLFEVKMVLVIRGFNRQDVGSYRCIAKNSLGEVESNIRLYEIPGPVRKVYPGPPYDEEDQQYEVYGSAEDQDQDELSNSVQLVPGWERPPTSGSPARTGSPGVQVVEPAHSGAARPGGLLGQVVSWIMAKGSSSLGLKEGRRSKSQEWIVAALLTWRRIVLGSLSGETVSWIKAVGSETLELNEVTNISNANEWIRTTVLSWRRFFLQLGFSNYVEDEMILAVSKQCYDSRDNLDACGLKCSR